MKLSEHRIYETKFEAKDDLRKFKEYHPNSKKKYKIVKKIIYLLEEVRE